MNRHHFFFRFLFSLILVIGLCGLIGVTQAQVADPFGAGAVAGTASGTDGLILGGDDIRVTVVKIIRAVLSLLGIIALSLIVYAGFTWMTSNGNEEKIAEAKGILTNAVIGLAIILSAFAIVQFVLSRLQQATGVGVKNEQAVANCGPLDCNEIVVNGRCGFGDNQFVVLSITPNTPVNLGTGMSNIRTRVLFSKKLADNQNLNEVFTLKANNNNVAMRVEKIADGYGVEASFDKIGACVADANESSCLPKDNSYQVVVNPNLRSFEGIELQEDLPCARFPREASFSVNSDSLDKQPPILDPIRIINGGEEQIAGVNGHGANGEIIVERGKEYPFATEIRDRRDVNGTLEGGVSYLQYRLSQIVPAPQGQLNIPDMFDGPRLDRGSNNPFAWSSSLLLGGGFPVPSTYRLEIFGHDIDHNQSRVSADIIVVGEGCLNGGGQNGCLVPDGGQCVRDQECGSQKCLNGQCVAWPMITNVSPMDGATGNWLTISGTNFGSEPGSVAFGQDTNQDGQITNLDNWIPALFPACGGADVWHNDWIIVEVPGNLPLNSLSSIRVIKRLDNPNNLVFEDLTTDNHGPKPGLPERPGLFLKNEVRRPGLCSVTTLDTRVNVASADVEVVATGQSFGNGNNSSLRFGNVQAETSAWGDLQILGRTPRNLSGQVAVSVRVGEISSNGVPFTLLSQENVDPPIIESVDPLSTTQRSLVTLRGRNFGAQVGTLWSAPTVEEVRTCASPNGRDPDCVQLPLPNSEICGNTWSDTQVVLRVPENMPLGLTHLLLVSASGRASDGQSIITIVAGAPLPGVCALQPVSGPAPLPEGNLLTILGENLGDNPKLYFWKRGADPANVDTWFALGFVGQDEVGIHRVQNGQTILTDLPLENNLSMPPGAGPIRVRSNDVLSNSINYTVSDCTAGGVPPRPGYQCCVAGPDRGFWKPEAAACAGEVREAGYVWRFSSGKIPSSPRVIEACAPDNLQQIPSPSPAVLWREGENSCLNSEIVVRFTENMDPNSFDNNVRVYSCEGDIEPDCRPAHRIDVTAEYTRRGSEGVLNGFNLRRVDQNSTHKVNTWYRIVLTTGVRSLQPGQNGQPPRSIALLPTKPLAGEDDVAYYFDFKTGNGMCQLTGVTVEPAEFTATELGVLLDPRYNQNPLFPLYYALSGRGNRACTIISAGQGWDWSVSRLRQAVNIAHATEQVDDDRSATVELFQDDELGPVDVVVASSTLNLEADSALLLDIGAPRVVDFWPNCSEACPNATVGVRFSRAMWLADLHGKVLRLYQCRDESCGLGNLVEEVEFDQARVGDPLVYEKMLPLNTHLDPASWYLVVISENVRSVGDVRPPGRPGKTLAPLDNGTYRWKFRTKDSDELCILDTTLIEPNPFVATQIGQKTAYFAIPVSSPDACSPRGQRLNPWGYGWRWDSTSAPVATVSDFQTGSQRQPFCSNSCLSLGSDISSAEEQSLCGNGTIDPGEDCDVAGRIPGNPNAFEIPGVSCTLSCLRPGNPLAGTPGQAGVCGNNQVDFAQGEECDPANGSCSATCLHVGSSQVQPAGAAPDVSWCGSGEVTGAEDCDIALSSELQRQNGWPRNQISNLCSQSCLHLGTPLSQSYCTTQGNREVTVNGVRTLVRNTNECQNAQSVCGNEIVEDGEQCDFVFAQNADGSRGDLLDNQLRVRGAQNPLAVASARSYCTASCLLTNLCAAPQNLAQVLDANHLRCVGDEGCSDECTLLGSSALYSQPSLCGDGKDQNGSVGIGEDPICELPRNEARLDVLGQNPVQVVTAVGNGEVDPAIQAQKTQIQSFPTQVRTRDNTVQVFDNNFQNERRGSADYFLQCGYTEFFQTDLLAQRDGNMELNHVDFWEERSELGPEMGEKRKTDAAGKVFSGRNSLFLSSPEDDWGVEQTNLSAEAGKRYQLRFHFLRTLGDGSVGLTYQNANRETRTILEEALVGEEGEWNDFTREVVIPRDFVDGFTLFVALKGAFYIDEMQLVESEQVGDQAFNNCPDNANNFNGVGANSCCYPRPVRVSEYPLDGSGLPGVPQDRAEAVCRNTYIKVDFDKRIDADTLQNNILIARGDRDRNHNCAAGGEFDVTNRLGDLLAQVDDQSVPTGFWQKIWFSLKKVLAQVVRPIVWATNYPDRNVQVWCAGNAVATTEATYQVSPDGVNTTTTVSVYLDQALEANTTYAVVLRGGGSGIKDERGVGIRSRDVAPGQVADPDDVFVFRTGAEICRLDSVTVTPAQHLFTVPSTVESFLAEAVSANHQLITRTEAYDWAWSWIPTGTPLYQIPAVPGGVENEPSIDIAATNLEGNLAVAAQARVIRDATVEGNHVGQVFSGFTNLRSLFCQRPWPVREFFPYEDGSSFGLPAQPNNDAYQNNQFTGEPISPVGGEYFNFLMGYCADAGLATTPEDDLPYLRPVIATDGVCQYSRTSCQVDEDCPYVSTGPGFALINGGSQKSCAINFPGDAAASGVLYRTDKPARINLQGGVYNLSYGVACQSDQDCRIAERYQNSLDQWSVRAGNKTIQEGAAADLVLSSASCVPHNPPLRRDTCLPHPEPTTPDDAQKQVLFFNDQNDDVIGLKVYQNPERLSVVDWYRRQPFAAQNLQPLSVDGYDAATDGNNYFVNALNAESTGQIRNYIYVLSINAGAQGQTRQVLDQLIDSLRFNINLSEFGYCLNDTVPGNKVSTVGQSVSTITNIACQSDFDCRAEDGSALPQTNGVCSNAKTKFRRDWDRIQDTRVSQTNLDAFKREKNTYPNLLAGTYIPRYTNSRWPSWGVLSTQVGGISLDPLNLWSTCQGNDPQTCWNVASSRFICPAYSSVTEYEFVQSTNDYRLHVPLEYFQDTDDVLTEFINKEKFTSEALCRPGLSFSPFVAECGDGILNPTVEECDPPGSTTVSVNGCPNDQIRSNVCSADCRIQSGECRPLGICGNGVREGAELCDEGASNGPYGACTSECRVGVAYCGNNVLDRNPVGSPFEFCDDVGGVCRYFSDNGSEIKAKVYIVLDRSGSMTYDFETGARNAPRERQRWTQAVAALNRLSEEIVGPRLAEVGLSVFSTTGIDTCSATEILPIQERTAAQFRAAYQGIVPNAGTPTVDALKYVADNRNRIFGNDPQIPRMVVLVTDGDPDWNAPAAANCLTTQNVESNMAKVEEQIHTLSEAGIPTYVIGYESGASLENLNRMAAAGGTDSNQADNLFFSVTSDEDLTNALTSILSCKTYSPYERNSCSWDCQSGGGFCGDGVVQQNEGELCDDGNRTEQDGCSNLCRVENIACKNQVYFTTTTPGGQVLRDQGTDTAITRVYIREDNQPIQSCVINTTPTEICRAYGLTCNDRVSLGALVRTDTCNTDLSKYVNQGGASWLDCVGTYTGPQIVGQPLVAGNCGNGIVDPGEACDTRDNNGQQCTPGYNQECSYCSVDCRETLRVQASAYCGNGVIDPGSGETCEKVGNGVVALDPSHPDREINQCPVQPNQFLRGGLSCSDDCRLQPIGQTCISCGLIENRGAVPRLTILNPMVPVVQNIWSDATQVALYRKAANSWSTDKIDRLGLRSLSGLNYKAPFDFLQPRQLENGVRLESNASCSLDYGVAFNVRGISEIISGNADQYDLSQNIAVEAETPGGWSQVLDIFPFSVAGEGRLVQHEVIASPAVPAGVFRVVVRWTKAEADVGLSFPGYVYNANAGLPIVSLAGVIAAPNQSPANRLAFADNYWVPSGNAVSNIWTHPIINSVDTYIQSFTLDTRDINNLNQPFAFFVGAGASDPSFQGSIGQYRDKDVVVELYDYHQGQIPSYSLYLPRYVFRLNAADQSGNPAAKYWHVFNLVKVNGQYRVQNVRQRTPDGAGFTEHENGSIETDFSANPNINTIMDNLRLAN